MHPTKEPELFDRADLVDLGLRSPKPFDTGGNEQLSEMFGTMEIGGTDDGDYDEDDIDQLNIDEVDQARSDVLDNNLTVDEEFQHSLNERANQFSAAGSEGNSINTTSFPSIPKPKVDYQYNDDFSLENELNDWFTANELKKLPLFKQIYMNVINVPDFGLLSEYEQSKVVQLLLKEVQKDEPLNVLYCITYISLGSYGTHKNLSHHVESVKKNNRLLSENNITPILIKIITKSFYNAKESKDKGSFHSNVLFLSSTILFFLICCELDSKDQCSPVSDQLEEQDFLNTLVIFIDEWRWNSLPNLRIRNIIALFAKTFQFLIGGLNDRSKSKDYTCAQFGISKEQNPSKLTTTPLDYYVFREDILARYPTSIPVPSTLPANFENSSSLSQFINIARTLETSKSNAALPVPSVHIATPASSPPSTPVNKTNKVKRSYQTNQSYPFIYPTVSGETEYDVINVPKSIEEASQLCASRVQEKLSLKQLWNERDHFMQQERGWTDTLNHSDSKFDDYRLLDPKPELKPLIRVENFYSKSIPYLSSLVHVLLQVIISSQENNQLLEDDSKDTLNQMDLELIKAKEVSLKNGSYILVLVSKWLKVSHILKFEYLCTLIYDSNYFAILMQYLKSTGDSLFSRIRNTVLNENRYSFWSQCASLSPSAYSIPKPTCSIDENFCFSLTNLLTIGSLICHNKTQRIIALSEKDPARLFKPFFLIINSSLWKPVLKMVKEITPFNGRKWKSYNMDLISMVYLHMKPQLKENWLSGRDLDGELKDAYGQEIALRAIIQFYNLRRYGDVMSELGYEKRGSDFFTREMELLAVSDT